MSINPSDYVRAHKRATLGVWRQEAQNRDRVWELMNRVVGATVAGNATLAQEYLKLLELATRERRKQNGAIS